MRELFSLGNIYVSDFLKENESDENKKFELKLVLDEKSKCVRLEKSAPADLMYGKYWYRSGINNSMKKELKEIVEYVLNIRELKENDVWLDIACNDGTLLSFLPKNLIKIGIDPADDSYKLESSKHADEILQNFFSKEIYKKGKFGHLKPKVITTIAMFYDLEEPEVFIKDVYDIIDDDGIWILQMSYTPLMIKQIAFDNICHEHVYYYSLFNIKNMLEKNGFKIMNCELNDVNGGSFRIYCMKQNGDSSKFATQPYRDVCNFRINSILSYEKELKLDEEQIWLDFFNQIENLKEKTMSFLLEEKKKGKKIWGYGASTKGNTLLQYFGIDNNILDGIAERSKYKWGLKTIGSNIPIFSEEEMRKEKPDYLLVLPWHFINEFIIRESDLLSSGTKFIVPCPKFEIIGKK
jgi:NDP-4-keto-2,6-dideoxyhexose 3-C-methyltransferase